MRRSLTEGEKVCQAITLRHVMSDKGGYVNCGSGTAAWASRRAGWPVTSRKIGLVQDPLKTLPDAVLTAPKNRGVPSPYPSSIAANGKRMPIGVIKADGVCARPGTGNPEQLPNSNDAAPQLNFQQSGSMSV
jgi:hypothetical protein